MIEQGISIDLSTVYRTLETLREKGLLIKHDRMNDTRALYEYDRREHKHYLVCLGCNKKFPIRHCPLKEYEKDLEKATDFVIAGHKLDIFGYCAECQKKVSWPSGSRPAQSRSWLGFVYHDEQLKRMNL